MDFSSDNECNGCTDCKGPSSSTSSSQEENNGFMMDQPSNMPFFGQSLYQPRPIFVIPHPASGAMIHSSPPQPQFVGFPSPSPSPPPAIMPGQQPLFIHPHHPLHPSLIPIPHPFFMDQQQQQQQQQQQTNQDSNDQNDHNAFLLHQQKLIHHNLFLQQQHQQQHQIILQQQQQLLLLQQLQQQQQQIQQQLQQSPKINPLTLSSDRNINTSNIIQPSPILPKSSLFNSSSLIPSRSNSPSNIKQQQQQQQQQQRYSSPDHHSGLTPNLRSLNAREDDIHMDSDESPTLSICEDDENEVEKKRESLKTTSSSPPSSSSSSLSSSQIDLPCINPKTNSLIPILHLSRTTSPRLSNEIINTTNPNSTTNPTISSNTNLSDDMLIGILLELKKKESNEHVPSILVK